MQIMEGWNMITIRGNNVRKTVKLFEVFRTTSTSSGDNQTLPDETNQNMFVVGFIIGDDAIIR